MSYVLDKSREGFDKRLALFSAPPVETAIQDIYFKEYRPVGQISGKSTLEFDVYNNSADYIILSQAYILLTLQIYTDKNVPISALDNVALVNFPGCSVFRQQDFSLQHQVVSSSVGTNFMYKAIIDILLTQGRNDQLSWMSLGGFEKDTSDSMDNCEPLDSPNAGLGNRYTKTQGGKKAVYKTRLFNDLCQQDRMLLNNVPLNIKLYPATDEQRLMYKTKTSTFPTVTPNPPTTTTAKSYHVHYSDATLVVPFARIHPGMITAQAEMLKKEMALYPFTKSEIKGYNIPRGSFNWSMDNLFQDTIPKRLVVAFLGSKAYSGDNEKNPFNFKEFGVSYLDFQIDGQSNACQVLQPDYKNDNYVQAYSKIFECMPPSQKEPPNISYYDFKRGYGLYVFDLEKSKDPSYSNPLRRGQTRLSVKFSAALTEPVTVLVYGTCEALLKIDEARNVIIES